MYAWAMRAAGWLVGSARDGDAAVRQALSLAPDVIVMDLEMPGVDGLAATRLIKDDARTRSVPVVLCTASSNAKARALAAGCAAFVVKPFDPEVLRVLLERIVVGGWSP
jgi:CheY-like chemotaxis protein